MNPSRRDVERRLDDLDRSGIGEDTDPFALDDEDREWFDGWWSRLPPEDRAVIWLQLPSEGRSEDLWSRLSPEVRSAVRERSR